MNEAETRAENIDAALKAAGWGVIEGSRIRREYPIAPGCHYERKLELPAALKKSLLNEAFTGKL